MSHPIRLSTYGDMDAEQTYKESEIYEQIKVDIKRAEEEMKAMENHHRARNNKRRDNNDDDTSTEHLIKEFEAYILDLSTMMNVVRSQIKYLGQLQQIFQNPYENNVGHPRPHKNTFLIPFIHGRREQMIAVLATLKAVIEERESFFRELTIWEKDLKLARTMVCTYLKPCDTGNHE